MDQWSTMTYSCEATSYAATDNTSSTGYPKYLRRLTRLALLVETSINTGIFSNTLLIVDRALKSTDNDGQLATSSGNTLVASYLDWITADGIAATITTTHEQQADSDADGTYDSHDADDDNDGIPDVVELSSSALDADGDGLPDYLDTDSDNDGITDLIEGSSDQDSDGTANYIDSDSDNDSIPDADEAGNQPYTAVDSDADGVADFLDLDSDNDGITDTIETLINTDFDNDGVPNQLDLDSDNDGVPDVVEASSSMTGFDADYDLDANYQLTGPYGFNGLADRFETSVDSGIVGTSDNRILPVDTDSDNQPDYLDLDSDDDGINDIIEGLSDNDANGVPDYRQPTDGYDENGNPDHRPPAGDSGADALPDNDTGSGDDDADGVPNNIDTDSDNDGITDLIEIGSQPDNPRDSDSDGISDYLDRDSDNDGLTDAIEAGNSDADSDGTIDGFLDQNQDGLDDRIDPRNLLLNDFDNDGIYDYRDRDSDNDGLTDTRESRGYSLDQNADGHIDNFIDLDADGIHDALRQSSHSIADSDADGLPDHLDLDSDNDGLFDLIEAGGQDDDRNGRVDSWVDSDNDGIVDTVDVDQTGGEDRDSDGIDDQADIDFAPYSADSDSDGIIDSRDPDPNGDGLVTALGAADSSLTELDGDGIPDLLPPFDPATANTDTDILTGLQGGVSGCSIGRITNSSGTSPPPTDPSFALMLMICVLVLWRRICRYFMVGTLPILILISNPIHAQQSSINFKPVQEIATKSPVKKIGRHFYIGAGISRTSVMPDTSNTTPDSVGNPGINVRSSHSQGTQLTLGMDLSKWFSVEAHAGDYGTAKLSPTGEIGYRQFGLSALAYSARARHHWLRNGLTGFARIGIGYMKNSASEDVRLRRVKAQHLLAGVGLEYSTSSGVGIRAEYVYYDEDLTIQQLALIYRLGKKLSSNASSESDPKLPETLIPIQTSSNPSYKQPHNHNPLPDSDRDGVENNLDLCQATPTGVPVDRTGCAVFNGVIQGLNFAPNSAQLQPDSKSALSDLLDTMRKHPSIRFAISAHTDNQGSAEANLLLSKNRALSVARYLVNAGIDVNRLKAKAFGELRPIADNRTAQGRAANRRVTLKVLADAIH